MNRLLSRWLRLEKRPLGRWLFGRMLVARVPYSGTLRPRVVVLAPRRAVVSMRDRRAVRNHLHSIHAAATMNLAELASGLALLSALPDDRRAILVRFTTTFTKKARGPLEAEGRLGDGVALDSPGTVEVLATVRDAAGDEVARAVAEWRIDPSPPARGESGFQIQDSSRLRPT